MGANNSSDLGTHDMKRIDRAIGREIEKDRQDAHSTIKLLLLGTGGCGKSTIMKQLKIIHARGFTDEDYKNQLKIMHSNILESMLILIEAMHTLGLAYSSPGNEKLATDVRTYTLSIFDPPDEARLSAIKALWEDGGIRKVLLRRNEFQLLDCAEYFLDRIDEITKKTYKMTQDDILHCRAATTGIIQVDFKIQATTFRVFDVGGQRSERKKWIHCFDDVHAIIYITAISEYDQVLAEDHSTNSLRESMRLFGSVCSSPWFTKTSMIVFLNKTDLFRAKLSQHPITVLFPEYTGSMDYEPAVLHIKQTLEALNKDTTKKIYMHETCATDTNQVQKIIKSVTSMVLASHMKGSGLS